MQNLDWDGKASGANTAPVNISAREAISREKLRLEIVNYVAAWTERMDEEEKALRARFLRGKFPRLFAILDFSKRLGIVPVFIYMRAKKTALKLLLAALDIFDFVSNVFSKLIVKRRTHIRPSKDEG